MKLNIWIIGSVGTEDMPLIFLNLEYLPSSEIF